MNRLSYRWIAVTTGLVFALWGVALRQVWGYSLLESLGVTSTALIGAGTLFFVWDSRRVSRLIEAELKESARELQARFTEWAQRRSEASCDLCHGSGKVYLHTDPDKSTPCPNGSCQASTMGLAD